MFPWRNDEELDLQTTPQAYSAAMFFSETLNALILYDDRSDCYVFQNRSVAYCFSGVPEHVALAIEQIQIQFIICVLQVL